MILAIDLLEVEVEKFNLYKAIQYLWLNGDSVTQYDEMEDFTHNYKEHITVVDGPNWVGVIDVPNSHFSVVDVSKLNETKE